MTTITAQMVKELRDKTGSGMLDCKNALKECAGDIEQALDWLRKKGLAAALKKSSRVAAEGVVGVCSNDNATILLEVNSETDFVSRNDKFLTFVADIMQLAFQVKSVEELLNLSYKDHAVKDELNALIATIGENINIRKLHVIMHQDNQYPFVYVHNKIDENIGKIAVAVLLDQNLPELGNQLAMHIAANKPQSLDADSLPREVVDREKDIQREIALQSGKPVEIVEKMLVGRIEKFYQDVCLMSQPFVMNPDIKVAKALDDQKTKIITYDYLVLGDGIEVEEVDFATEVHNTIKSE